MRWSMGRRTPPRVRWSRGLPMQAVLCMSSVMPLQHADSVEGLMIRRPCSVSFPATPFQFRRGSCVAQRRALLRCVAKRVDACQACSELFAAGAPSSDSAGVV